MGHASYDMLLAETSWQTATALGLSQMNFLGSACWFQIWLLSSALNQRHVQKELITPVWRIFYVSLCQGSNGLQGSFERLGESAVGASVPADYLQTAERHAAEGCYVLAMAHRWRLSPHPTIDRQQSMHCPAGLVSHSLAQPIARV